MKIAVIGVYYASNLGDAVLCDCVAEWIKADIPNAEIDVIDIEGKTKFEEQKDTSMRILKRRHRNLIWDYWQTKHGIRDRVYYFNQIDVESEVRQRFYDGIANRNYDAVVFAGGQLFMDWLSVDLCEFLKRFQKKKIPVFFNACGTGISISKKVQSLLREQLLSDNVKLISSRDDVSQIRRLYLDGSKRVIATYDPALWVSEVYPVNMKKEKVVGLGVMYSDHTSFKKLTKFWMKLIRELEKRNIKWKMFCNGAIDDYNFGKHVLQKMGLDVKTYLCDYAKEPSELIDQIASFDSLISFRLHSHIIAASLDIPAVAIVWDDKLRFFYRHLGHEERVKTIDESATEILDTLKQAKEEGYDRRLIQKQKHFARVLLIDTIKKETDNE